jgi:putative transposase
MSRKIKFSSNWRKAKAKVQRVHTRIGHARRDYLHKTTTTISKNHAMVCIEDLQVRNLSKSAKGTLEANGKNVRAKSALNKSILDQGWFEFRRQLDGSGSSRKTRVKPASVKQEPSEATLHELARA